MLQFYKGLFPSERAGFFPFYLHLYLHSRLNVQHLLYSYTIYRQPLYSNILFNVSANLLCSSYFNMCIAVNCWSTAIHFYFIWFIIQIFDVLNAYINIFPYYYPLFVGWRCRVIDVVVFVLPPDVVLLMLLHWCLYVGC